MKKRSLLAMLVTGGTAWLLAKANSQALRTAPNTLPSNLQAIPSNLQEIKNLKPLPYKGMVHKSLETFTLTTPGMTYHIGDPSQFIDEIAAEQGITSPFYDLETCVMAIISEKGQYGHLGHLDYELLVVGRCDDYDYTKAAEKK